MRYAPARSGSTVGRSGQGEAERAALADGTFQPDAAAVSLDDAGHDAQPEAGASGGRRLTAAGSGRGVEPPPELLLEQAGAGVDDVNANLVAGFPGRRG